MGQAISNIGPRNFLGKISRIMNDVISNNLGTGRAHHLPQVRDEVFTYLKAKVSRNGLQIQERLCDQ